MSFYRAIKDDAEMLHQLGFDALSDDAALAFAHRLLGDHTEALQCAREILSEAIRFSKTDVPESIVIADGDGRQLLAVSLAMVLPDHLRH